MGKGMGMGRRKGSESAIEANNEWSHMRKCTILDGTILNDPISVNVIKR